LDEIFLVSSKYWANAESFMSMSFLFSLVLASTSTAAGEPPIPENLREIPEAQFSTRVRSNEIGNRKALSLSKRNGCKTQDVSPVWDGMKVVALMLVNEQGKVKKISPVSIGCPAVEEYGAKQIAKYADKLTSRPRGEGSKWYRAQIIYYW